MSSDPVFTRVIARIDPTARLLRAFPLTGGISAQVTALEVALPDGQIQTWVHRRHGAADLIANPAVATMEYHLLKSLHTQGVPVPMPYLLDTSGDLFDQPYVVMEYIEGESDFNPSNAASYIDQCAAMLVAIHRVSLRNHELPPLPRIAERVAHLISQHSTHPDHTLGEKSIRAALATFGPLTPRNASVLLHGDYWPGNWLWRDGQLVAIIDWEDAAIGDPLADIANARLELFWALGESAPESFVAAYQAYIPTLDLTHLPYWDLVAALRPCGVFDSWSADKMVRERMRDQHAAFVAQAIANIMP